MTLLTLKWPRIGLLVATLSLLTLVGGANTGAFPSHQPIPPTPTPTPTPKLILLTDPVPDPKQAGVMWFPQTGHTLRGAFLDYWNRYGGLAQFGYPLTEEFFEPVGADNKMYQVQYFERNRFEYHPENKDPQYQVLLGALGLDFRKADPPSTPITGATYFRETGHNLSGKFKEYWETHGGLFVHGYPITEPAMERSTNGKEYLVQWFERSRFELHPENAGSPYEVLLGVLGRQLSEKKGYPFGWYPLYGYAPDYFWVAGRYVVDPLLFGNSGCDTVRYTHLRPVEPAKGVRIRPYGPVWDGTVRPGRDHGRFLVVFGHLDQPIEAEQGTETCEKPAYFVERVQMNPEYYGP